MLLPFSFPLFPSVNNSLNFVLNVFGLRFLRSPAVAFLVEVKIELDAATLLALLLQDTRNF